MTHARRHQAPPPGVLGGQGPSPRVPPSRGHVVQLGGRRRTPVPERPVVPHAREHQAFLGRVIDYLSTDRGVRQFVDWGCPVPGTAERIRQAHPDNTVVHIAPHGTVGMLSSPDNPVLSGSESSDSSLCRLTTCGLVDLDGPVAVLMTRPFSAEAPPPALDRLHYLMHGGGYLALATEAPKRDAEAAFAPFVPLEPGVADLRWWPYPDEDVAMEGTGILGGLARTRSN
ncbi:SAM-dependent methyltransferase [Nocardiopsis sp. HNM0947]|uniref:SAM-dependent methyltransferase n=1 Tax=Nocardiopsis coralli TaxID=2772213 RepID=A0ABR9P0S0_9ACTN|nr:SAM-dependent methyltransferase [Nocardiopsis coralli]MBE2997403.1 SAM-dependent methyltransferase [Nocardiopsis coralli]